MKKQILPLLVFCSHCVAMHGDPGDAARECYEAPMDQQFDKEIREENEREERYNRDRDGGLGMYYECTHAIEYWMSATH